jgi:hypothetical protein
VPPGDGLGAGLLLGEDAEVGGGAGALWGKGRKGEREREREKGIEVGGGGGRGAKGSALFRSQLFFFAWLAAVVLSLSLFSTLSFPFSISLSYLLDLAVRAGVDGRGADGDAGATRGVGEGLIEIFDDYFFPT